MSAPLVPPPHAAWLAMPETRNAIEGALRRRGVPRQDIEDERQQVLEAALGVGQPPVSLDQCIALVRKIAVDRAIEFHRRRQRRGRYDAGLSDDADERHLSDAEGERPDPIDVRRKLDVVARAIANGDVTARQAIILDRSVDGVPQEEIARSLNLTRKTVTNDLAGARRTIRMSWTAYAGAALFTAIALLFWITRREPEDPGVAAPRPEHHELTPEQKGIALRKHALDECAAGAWRACLDDLHAAGVLDPAGDHEPQVEQARKTAREHLGEGAQVPGSNPASGATVQPR